MGPSAVGKVGCGRSSLDEHREQLPGGAGSNPVGRARGAFHTRAGWHLPRFFLQSHNKACVPLGQIAGGRASSSARSSSTAAAENGSAYVPMSTAPGGTLKCRVTLDERAVTRRSAEIQNRRNANRLQKDAATCDLIRRRSCRESGGCGGMPGILQPSRPVIYRRGRVATVECVTDMVISYSYANVPVRPACSTLVARRSIDALASGSRTLTPLEISEIKSFTEPRKAEMSSLLAI